MITVLGFYVYWATSNHEVNAVIVKDGKILTAIEEDKITRVKHDKKRLIILKEVKK